MLRCFISYSHRDTAFVDMVVRLLALVPSSVRVFVDRTDHDPGAPLPQSLQAALDEADVLLPCVSPSYVASAWCTAERRWYLSRGPLRRVAPLRLVEHDSSQLDEGWFPDHPGFALVDWVRRGDLILFEQVLPALLGSEAPPRPARLAVDGTRGPALAADLIEVLATARRFELPAEADRALVQVATTMAQSAGMSGPARNALALAVAGNFVQRGEWAALKQWAESSEVEATDDDDARCQFHQFLGLAERRLGRLDAASAHLDEALRLALANPSPPARRRAVGQVRREQGTLSLGRVELRGARAHYRASREALADFPSEQAHVAQTWVKAAQIELLERDADAAVASLARAAELLMIGSAAHGHETRGATMIHAARVGAHYAKTLALAHYLRGRPGDAKRAAALHAHIIAPHAWANEQAQSRTLLRLLTTARLHPAGLRRVIVCLGILAESAGTVRGALRALWRCLRAARGDMTVSGEPRD